MRAFPSAPVLGELRRSNDEGTPNVPIADDGDEEADGPLEVCGRLCGIIAEPASERVAGSDFWARSVAGRAPPIFSNNVVPASDTVLFGCLSKSTTRLSLAQSSAPISWYALAWKYSASEATGLSG